MLCERCANSSSTIHTQSADKCWLNGVCWCCQLEACITPAVSSERKQTNPLACWKRHLARASVFTLPKRQNRQFLNWRKKENLFKGSVSPSNKTHIHSTKLDVRSKWLIYCQLAHFILYRNVCSTFDGKSVKEEVL